MGRQSGRIGARAMDDRQRRFLTEALESHGKEVRKNPEKAVRVLKRAGIMTAEGKLAPQYKYPRPGQ